MTNLKQPDTCPDCGSAKYERDTGISWCCNNSFHASVPSEGVSTGPDTLHIVLDAFNQWREDVGGKISASEANAFIDGFGVGVASQDTEIADLRERVRLEIAVSALAQKHSAETFKDNQQLAEGLKAASSMVGKLAKMLNEAKGYAVQGLTHGVYCHCWTCRVESLLSDPVVKEAVKT